MFPSGPCISGPCTECAGRSSLKLSLIYALHYLLSLLTARTLIQEEFAGHFTALSAAPGHPQALPWCGWRGMRCSLCSLPDGMHHTSILCARVPRPLTSNGGASPWLRWSGGNDQKEEKSGTSCLVTTPRSALPYLKECHVEVLNCIPGYCQWKSYNKPISVTAFHVCSTQDLLQNWLFFCLGNNAHKGICQRRT